MIPIIFLTLCALVTCENFAKNVQEEEQERYKEYLKAIASGNILPTLTQEEIADAEEMMADVYPLGDPDLPLPDTEEDLDKEICSVLDSNKKKIMSYVRKRYPTHLAVQIAVRINLHTLTEKNEDYCKTSAARKNYIKMAPIINDGIEKMKLARNQIIGSFRVVIYGQTSSSKLGIICCSYWTFKKEITNSVSNKEAKRFLRDMVNAYNGQSLEYLCSNYGEDSKKCQQISIPSPPENVDAERFKSIYSSAVEALSKVNSFE